jgi:predicted neuraminidase
MNGMSGLRKTTVLLVVLAGIVAVLLGMRFRHAEGNPGFEIPAVVSSQESEVPVFRSETINSGQDLPMVHVASLAELPDGMLSAVWYGGTRECEPDVKIYYSEQGPSGPWAAPRVIMSREQAEQELRLPLKGLGNAVLLSGRDGSLRMIFATIAMGRWSGSQLNSCVSKDGGITWSSSERLTLSPFFNFSELVRNRPVPLVNGGWCVPVYQEFLGKFPELLWLSEGEGRLRYRKSRIAGGCSTFQPTLVPMDKDRAVVFLRDYTPARKVFRSVSADRGNTWSAPEPTSLPNPDAGISALGISGGRILIAYNDSPKDRSNLSLAISPDGGKSWKKLVTLQQEEAASFSYPFLMKTSGGLIRLAYTWKGREIRILSFNESWLRSQQSGAMP